MATPDYVLNGMSETTMFHHSSDSMHNHTLDYNGNHSNETDPQEGKRDLVHTVVFASWLSISMVLAIFGNLMVIAVVWRHRGMRTRTNMFLVNLAVADFLVGILMAPFSLTTLIANDWILGTELCFVNSFFNTVCFITSIHTLMYISIHKYLSITRPLTRITKCKILIMITAAWSWGITCAALTTFILSHATYKEKTMQCGPEYPKMSPRSLAFHFIIQLSNIFLPLGIMLFAYFRMFKEIKNHMQRLDENTAMDRQQIYSQQRRVTVTLFIVLACFVLCWIPYCIYANYVTFEEDKSRIPAYANAIAYCCGYMNSACNPIIYAWRSPSFREGYKEILCQEPSYVVSDDTMHESSPGPRNKFSVFLNSVRSRHGSRRSSEESITQSEKYSVRTSKGSQSSTNSTHKLLRKLTSRTSSKGSSIIKRDGSVILVKNGKIISMREDVSNKKKKNLLDDVFLPNPVPPKNKSHSVTSPKSVSGNSGLNVLYEQVGESVDLSPLLGNGLTARCSSISDDSVSHHKSEDGYHLQQANNHTDINSVRRKMDSESDLQQVTMLNTAADRMSKNNLENDVQIQVTDVDYENPGQRNCDDQSESCLMCNKLVTFKPMNGPCKHSQSSLSPSKDGIKRTKSDDIRNHYNLKLYINYPVKSKSSEFIYQVPLLENPRVEQLNVTQNLPRSSSDTELHSPDSTQLYIRRWSYKGSKNKNSAVS